MDSAPKSPYVSFIIYARNDDHGGNMLERMRVSLWGLLLQLERHRIESEVILVDWNPPSDKPRLKDAIEWPRNLEYPTMRVIEVGLSIHRRSEYWDKRSIHATAAVNCGVRRARGEFITQGGIDLLYPDELMAFIGRRELKQDERYRADRCDVDGSVVGLQDLDDQLRYSRNNVTARYSFNPPKSQTGLPKLHTNACGDFQLMSGKQWRDLRGYREADMSGNYADGLLSYMSYAAGVSEVVLTGEMCVYKITHGNQFKTRLLRRPPMMGRLFGSRLIPTAVRKRLLALYDRFFYKGMIEQVDGVPTLTHWQYLNLCQELVAGIRPPFFNDDNWGLGDDTLHETVVSAGSWDRQLRS